MKSQGVFKFFACIGGHVHYTCLIVYVALLLFEKRDKAIDFFGRAVPHFDLVLRSAATHLHWPTVHSQTTYHPRELMVRVIYTDNISISITIAQTTSVNTDFTLTCDC